MSTTETPDLLTTEEARRLLRVSRATMYRHIEDGSIPSVRLTATGAIRIPRRELERRLFGEEN
jgi:excisionase family DNA binding protein